MNTTTGSKQKRRAAGVVVAAVASDVHCGASSVMAELPSGDEIGPEGDIISLRSRNFQPETRKPARLITRSGQ